MEVKYKLRLLQELWTNKARHIEEDYENEKIHVVFMERHLKVLKEAIRSLKSSVKPLDMSMSKHSSKIEDLFMKQRTSGNIGSIYKSAVRDRKIKENSRSVYDNDDNHVVIETRALRKDGRMTMHRRNMTMADTKAPIEDLRDEADDLIGVRVNKKIRFEPVDYRKTMNGKKGEEERSSKKIMNCKSLLNMLGMDRIGKKPVVEVVNKDVEMPTSQYQSIAQPTSSTLSYPTLCMSLSPEKRLVTASSIVVDKSKCAGIRDLKGDSKLSKEQEAPRRKKFEGRGECEEDSKDTVKNILQRNSEHLLNNIKRNVVVKELSEFSDHNSSM